MGGHRVQNKYTINFGKKIQETMRNAKVSAPNPRGRLYVSLPAFHLPWLNFTPFGAAAPRGFFSFSAQKYAESLR